MKPWLIVVALCALTACNNLSDSMEKTTKLSKDNWHQLQKKYWSLYHYEPYDPPAQLAQVRYCYKSDSDITCYHRPQPHLSSRLFGYQGPPPEEMLAAMDQRGEMGEMYTPEAVTLYQEGSIQVSNLPNERNNLPVETVEAMAELPPAEAQTAPQKLF